MANTYKNIVITPNTAAATGLDPSIQFSGANATVNTDVTLRVYPDSNGTVSFEAAAGQLLSITNDLSNTIFTVNDVSGMPLVEVNVTSQQITFGQFYGNVGIGTAAGTSSIYKLDCNGSANISSPTLLVAGQNVISSFAACNAFASFAANNKTVAAKAASYGLAITDVGSVIAAVGTIFVPNAVFSAGNTMYIFNNTTSSITITQNSNVSLVAGGLATGNRTLAANCLAHMICTQGKESGGNTFVFSGVGLS